jgi:hypothetical protein
MENLLRETIALQNIGKAHLLDLGINRFSVPDTIAELLPACTGIREYVSALKHLSKQDGVHLTAEGYRKYAELVIAESNKRDTVGSLSVSVPAVAVGKKLHHYYWRGFSSPVGSSRPKNHTEAYLQSHGGGKWSGRGASGRGGGGIRHHGQTHTFKTPPPYRGRGKRGH